MTRRRWIADEVSGKRAALVGSHADHLVRVLRARVGQEFDIAVGNEVRSGRISSVQPDRVEFELGDPIASTNSLQITLVLAIFKFDRMEWAIEKCTELGVTRIVPVIASRTDTHLAAAAPKRRERWQRLARQASEQSRRAAVPDISTPIDGKQAADLPGDMRIVLAESERQLTLKQALADHRGSLVLAVGPEGGWTKQEIELFARSGWTSASLGDTVLRSETAAISALAIAMSELG
jgi:16S rRNA (uracil1498-N3)-methyltransferase